MSDNYLTYTGSNSTETIESSTSSNINGANSQSLSPSSLVINIQKLLSPITLLNDDILNLILRQLNQIDVINLSLTHKHFCSACKRRLHATIYVYYDTNGNGSLLKHHVPRNWYGPPFVGQTVLSNTNFKKYLRSPNAFTCLNNLVIFNHSMVDDEMLRFMQRTLNCRILTDRLGGGGSDINEIVALQQELNKELKQPHCLILFDFQLPLLGNEDYEFTCDNFQIMDLRQFIPNKRFHATSLGIMGFEKQASSKLFEINLGCLKSLTIAGFMGKPFPELNDIENFASKLTSLKCLHLHIGRKSWFEFCRAIRQNSLRELAVPISVTNLCDFSFELLNSLQLQSKSLKRLVLRTPPYIPDATFFTAGTPERELEYFFIFPNLEEIVDKMELYTLDRVYTKMNTIDFHRGPLCDPRTCNGLHITEQE